MPDFLAPHTAHAPRVHDADEFSDITPRPVRALKEKPLTPVPASIVKLAQAALDGLPDPDYPDQVVHSASHTFRPGEEQRAERFAGHMKNAAGHTVPPSRITVESDGLKVSYRVGKPRGPRKPRGSMDQAQG